MRRYVLNVLIAIDQLAHVILFDGDPDETISSWVGREFHGQWPEKLIDWIFLYLVNEKDHCLNSIEREFM